MKILVVGSGAGAHALAWKLAQSDRVTTIYVAPGNPGTQAEAKVENIDVAQDDLPGLAHCAKQLDVDFTLVTPTPALANGIVDLFEASGLRILAPNQAATKLEWSKVYAKSLLTKHGIATPAYQVFSNAHDAKAYVRGQAFPLVVKADGYVNGGTGVVVAQTLSEAEVAIDTLMREHKQPVLIEAFIAGREVSFTVLYDGDTMIPLADSRDYKKLFDGDIGPNTSGMGAYSPVLSAQRFDQVMAELVTPTIAALGTEDIDYRGFLYFGVIFDTTGKPFLLEINCRLGNPELFTILHRLNSDLAELLDAAVQQRLHSITPTWHPHYAVAVHATTEGYPFTKRSGDVIALPPESRGRKIFHSATSVQNDQLLTKSGRILAISAIGHTLEEARTSVYDLMDQIHFEGMHFRTDIGAFNVEEWS